MLFRSFWPVSLPRLMAISLVGMMAVGCSSTKPPAAAPVTSAVAGATATLPPIDVTSPPAPTAPDEPQAVLNAYDVFEAARHELFANPTRNSPVLQRYMTGEYREIVRNQLEDQLSKGFVSAFPSNSIARHTTRINALSKTSASLVVCVVDDGFHLFPKDGHRENEGTSTYLVSVMMTKEDEQWKVEMDVTTQETVGVAGCALQQ
jgi:hypothetical protein